MALKTATNLVHSFHHRFGVPCKCDTGLVGPAVRQANLRAALIAEEARETVDAILRADLVETIDGLCDLIYVSLGAAQTFGVDLDKYFIEVHESNMRKIGGAFRPDGKILKPEGWEPPRIAEFLNHGVGV